MVGTELSGPVLLTAARELMTAWGARDESVVHPFSVKGRTIYLKTFTAERQVALFAWRQKNPGDTIGAVSRLIAASVTDEDGNELLTPDDVVEFDEVSVRLTFFEILRRNRMV